MNAFPQNSTVVLTHGAWADGSCWKDVILPLAANYYDVNLAETSWHDLDVHPQKNRREAAATSALTREHRTRKENRR